MGRRSHGLPVRLVHVWTVGNIQDFAWVFRHWLQADSQAPAAHRLAAATQEAALLVLGTHYGIQPASARLAPTALTRLAVPIAIISPTEPITIIHKWIRFSSAG